MYIPVNFLFLLKLYIKFTIIIGKRSGFTLKNTILNLNKFYFKILTY